MSNSMPHSAAGSLAGFEYQIHRALLILLSIEEEQSVEIETYDDVVILDGKDSISVALQVKHSLGATALSTSSVEWWKTLRVWCWLVENKKLSSHSKLFLASTGEMPAESKLRCLLAADRKRNPNISATSLILELNKIANDKPNAKLHAAYESWLLTSERNRDELIGRVHIFHAQSALNKIVTAVDSALVRRVAVTADRVAPIRNTLLGWLHNLMGQRLGNGGLRIKYEELLIELTDIRDRFSPNVLPSTGTPTSLPDLSVEQERQPNYLRQLDLLNADVSELQFALESFYQAQADRDAWRQGSLIGATAIQQYEQDLITTWRVLFNRHACAPSNDLSQQVSQGRSVYYECLAYRGTLRTMTPEKQVSCGTYHILSDGPTPCLGWHPEYKKRLLGK